MTNHQHQSKNGPDIPAPTVLTSWANELQRLASAVEQDISSKNFVPSVVSSLTAITPIVNLLSESLMTVVMNELTWPESEVDDKSEDAPKDVPGYL